MATFIFISLIVIVIAMAALFLVIEIRCAQRGWDTWEWVRKLYANSPRLQRIRW